ncbi:MAG: hypothetical protein IJN70_09375 [Clostridia bacterium]|nr:hypothetical protein [Clostridia bacterium]
MAAGEDALKLREPKYPYRPIPPMEEIIGKLYDEPSDVINKIRKIPTAEEQEDLC